MKLITKSPDKQLVDAYFDPHEGVLFVRGEPVPPSSAAAEYQIHQAHPKEVADLRKAGYSMKRAPRPGNKLRQWRLRRKLSQRELAEKVGVSPRAIGFWETKGANPRSPLVEAYAKALGTTPAKVRGALKPHKPKQRAA